MSGLCSIQLCKMIPNVNIITHLMSEIITIRYGVHDCELVLSQCKVSTLEKESTSSTFGNDMLIP
jgi:hypothetical protein